MKPTIVDLQKRKWLVLAVLWTVIPLVSFILALAVGALLYVNPDLGQAAGLAITLWAVCALAASITIITIGE